MDEFNGITCSHKQYMVCVRIIQNILYY